MPEDVSPSLEQSPETAPQSEAPTDFRAYAKWRETGELPEPKAEPQAAPAAEDTPPAKTEPDPEPEKTQEPDEQDDEDQTASKGRGGSRQRKIDKLTRENADLQRQLAAIREQPPAEGQGSKRPASAPAEGKPKLEDCETLEAYQEALTDWKLDEREHVRKAQDLQRQAHEAEQKIQTEWSKREKQAAKLHDDYDDVIDTVKPPEGPGVLAARQAMLEDEAGPEILYYLAKHPDELKRIAALTPVSAVREIGRLSAKLTISPAPENGKPKVTGAPKPPPPSGRPTKTSTDDINDPEVVNDYSRWERLRMAQLRSK